MLIFLFGSSLDHSSINLIFLILYGKAKTVLIIFKCDILIVNLIILKSIQAYYGIHMNSIMAVSITLRLLKSTFKTPIDDEIDVNKITVKG